MTAIDILKATEQGIVLVQFGDFIGCTLWDAHVSATWRFRMSRLCAAAMRPYIKLECGPMPNVMAALPNTGGGLCSTPQSLTDAHY